jgi:NAD(P)-dependent dehydrogenase (short-subunit alcohol dehydrogenase family)
MSEKPLAGKVALITGSYRNLGAVTAETFASYGAKVILNDLPSPNLYEVRDVVLAQVRAHGVEAVAIPADLSKSDEVRRLCREAIQAFGKVDILINNAGPFNMDPYLALKEEDWDRVMDVNLKAIYLTAQELAPQMKKNGWGRIVSMSAGSAYVRNHNVYTLAKLGVQVITESLALELGPEITVNAVAPGQIYESLPDIAEFDPTFGERYTARTPTKRLVTRKEVANLIAMLCTPAFDQVSGVTIRIDGGAELPRF